MFDCFLDLFTNDAFVIEQGIILPLLPLIKLDISVWSLT